MRHTVFLFGEAERGELCSPYLCSSLSQLADSFGNPPAHTSGIYYAIQALTSDRDIIYFRVDEEGFSREDYYEGIHFIESQQIIGNMSAICLPGVGDPHILEAARLASEHHNSMLILEERDLFDFLTSH